MKAMVSQAIAQHMNLPTEMLEIMANSVLEVFYKGKPSHVVTMEKMKKTPVEGGWLYCFYDNDKREWGVNWHFVPSIIC